MSYVSDWIVFPEPVLLCESPIPFHSSAVDISCSLATTARTPPQKISSHAPRIFKQIEMDAIIIHASTEKRMCACAENVGDWQQSFSLAATLVTNCAATL
jgi:hypothetical protein